MPPDQIPPGNANRRVLRQDQIPEATMAKNCLSDAEPSSSAIRPLPCTCAFPERSTTVGGKESTDKRIVRHRLGRNPPSPKVITEQQELLRSTGGSNSSPSMTHLAKLKRTPSCNGTYSIANGHSAAGFKELNHGSSPSGQAGPVPSTNCVPSLHAAPPPHRSTPRTIRKRPVCRWSVGSPSDS